MGGIIKFVEKLVLKSINVDRDLPIQIDITNACNLRCSHCYHPHHKNEGAISLDDWKNVLLQYKKMIQKMRFNAYIVICGGEPLTSPFLFPLLNFISIEMKEASVTILTNGTLFSESKALELKKFNKIKFQVSLDGPSSERHDSIRGLGNFEKAINGIRILKKLGFSVNVLSVLSKKTAPWMEDFFKLAKSENFNSMNFTRFVSEGSGKKLVEALEDEPLLGFDLKTTYERLLHLILKYQVQSRTQGPLFDLIVPGLGRSGRFWESIVIDYQGFIIASSRSKLRLGHALNDGIEKIFTKNETYKKLRLGKVDGCGQCSLYSVCGGDRNAAYAATGDFLGKDPGCWKETIQTITLQRRAL